VLHHDASPCILGAGAWGTAMAVALAGHGSVRLWCRDSAAAAELQASRQNARLLPGVLLPEAVSVSADLPAAVAGASLVGLAVPVNALRDTCRRLGTTGDDLLAPGAVIVLLCKGFELATGDLPHRIAESELPGHAVMVLSGPSFASEVGRGLPTAMTLAAADLAAARQLIDGIHVPRLRVYASDDRVGVEVGGALKNVIAIACGISDALGFGHNARAALITRGLAEMTRLGTALGAQAQTFSGLAGLGDLVLTTTSDQSRNRRVGLMVGAGESLDAAMAKLGQVAEGVKTAAAVFELSQRLQIELPISALVHRVLSGELPPQAAVAALLSREPKCEFGG